MKTCLIVDDCRVIRMIARKILEELQFEIREASNGAEALQLCCEVMPDAVLLDWNMPVMSGLEFLREIRSLPDGAGPVVVFCTTESDLSRIEEALASGADEYIMKPFDRDILQLKFEQAGLLN